MAVVARLSVTPVKSTSLAHPDEVRLGRGGAQGDHMFLFLEADGSRVRDARKAPLLGVRCRYEAARDRLVVETPEGDHVEADAAPTDEPIDVALFDRSIRAARVRGPIDEVVSRRAGRPLGLARVVPPERAGGAHPVSIVSLASVAELGWRAGTDDVPDPRRFRMLVELEECEPFEEDGWAGRRVRLGEAVVRVGESMARCMLTTLDPDTGVHDFPTLDVLATFRRRHGELVFGVDADVDVPGVVRVGDRVAPEAQVLGRSASR